MRNLLSYWDAALVIVMMLFMFGVLSIGVGLAVYLLASSFAPAVLAMGAGALVFLALLFMFYKAILDA